LKKNHYLSELVSLAVSLLSPAFSKALAEKIPKPAQTRFYLDALEILDIVTIMLLT
jgi:hypothetical protein